jgi:hypothetical protein
MLKVDIEMDQRGCIDTAVARRNAASEDGDARSLLA